jgi:hypothetical protein
MLIRCRFENGSLDLRGPYGQKTKFDEERDQMNHLLLLTWVDEPSCLISLCVVLSLLYYELDLDLHGSGVEFGSRMRRIPTNSWATASEHRETAITTLLKM